MPGYLSKKFHHETNHDFPIGTAPMNSQYWPKEWKEIHHKEYPRFPKISLPAYPLPLGELDKAFEDRRSAREYNINQSLTLDELNTLLYYSAGVKPSADYDTEVRRHYPSGGALYPLEMYLLIQRVVGIGPGIYHYNVKKHTLENLTSEKEEMEKLKDGLLYPWSRDGDRQ